tara:strand:+ start:223 stop:882 length:660 start_codon:yes stop_codon:yes gene_type:complete
MAVQQFLMMGRAGLDSRNIITGSMWVYGYGGYGVTGLGNTDNVTTPTKLGTLETWQNTISPGMIYHNRIAVKSDGTLWSWGLNNSGVGGHGDTTSRSSPVQVGSLTDWKEAGCNGSVSAAIKTDGTLWTWGDNGTGGLGHGGTTSVSSPVQVGSATDWQHVIIAEGDWAFVMKTNGALYYAGTVVGHSNVSTFTQVGSETGFVDAISTKSQGIVAWKEA